MLKNKGSGKGVGFYNKCHKEGLILGLRVFVGLRGKGVSNGADVRGIKGRVW